jgi:chemotaxis protein histidine kinase CheA
LSIVRHAIAALNGTVSLASEPGTGTRVTVTLPKAL